MFCGGGNDTLRPLLPIYTLLYVDYLWGSVPGMNKFIGTPARKRWWLKQKLSVIDHVTYFFHRIFCQPLKDLGMC